MINLDFLVGKKILKMSFFVFDTTIENFTVTDEIIEIDNVKYFMLQPDNPKRNKIPFFEQSRLDDVFIYEDINQLNENKNNIINEFKKITNHFFMDIDCDEKKVILSNIDNIDWDNFIKNKFYKFF